MNGRRYGRAWTVAGVRGPGGRGGPVCPDEKIVIHADEVVLVPVDVDDDS
ncbi:hypothetical protein H1Q78_08965 [Cellulosimicrobium cellulans]|nr:hypothetical protein H1Q78_08965 [Cellulosimicrobium cellulans]